jgi:hypothetical protein
MNKTAYYDYYGSDGLQTVRLPYSVTRKRPVCRVGRAERRGRDREP